MSSPASSATPRRRQLRRALLAGVMALLVTGCNTVGFYKQAAAGQYEVWSRQEKISALLARTNTPAALRAQLELVLELRQFAERELKLKTGGHYARYADLGRPYVVWNVYAAPEFSMEPKRWWYPIVGRLKYRGFFAEADAEACAARLSAEGYDVHVGGVDAYSTLGFFKDPVLNTFIHHPPADLAETLFHELAHQRVFANGDTDFNEAFATAVGEEGARRWIAAHGDATMRAAYDQDLRRKEQFVALVMQARAALEKLYRETERADGPAPGGDPLPDAARRAAKAHVIAQLHTDYAQLKASWHGYRGYDGWFQLPINNARLNTVATYYKLLPAFERLLAKHGGDLGKFYSETKAIAASPKAERHDRLLAASRPERQISTSTR